MSASMILSVGDVTAASSTPLMDGGGAASGDAAAFGALIDAATMNMMALADAAPPPSLPAGEPTAQPMPIVMPESEGQGLLAPNFGAAEELPARPINGTKTPALPSAPKPTPAVHGSEEHAPQPVEHAELPSPQLAEAIVPAPDAKPQEEAEPQPDNMAVADAPDPAPLANPVATQAAMLAQAAVVAPMPPAQPLPQSQNIEPDTNSVADVELPHAHPSAPATKASASKMVASTALSAEHKADLADDRNAASTPVADSGAVQASASGGDQADSGLPAPLLTQTMSPVTSRPAASPYPAQVQAATHAPIVHAQPGRIGADIGVEIARAINGDKEDLLIRLDPREMGRIDVRLSFDRDGMLRAVMSADSPAALDMLRRESGDLNRALADAGIRSDGQSLRFDARSGEGNGQSGQRWQQDRPGSAHNHMNSGGGEVAEPQYRPLRTSGQIDLIA